MLQNADKNMCCIFSCMTCKKHFPSPPPSAHTATFSPLSELVTWPRLSRPLMCQCPNTTTTFKWYTFWESKPFKGFFSRWTCFHHQFLVTLRFGTVLEVMVRQFHLRSSFAFESTLMIWQFLSFHLLPVLQALLLKRKKWNIDHQFLVTHWRSEKFHGSLNHDGTCLYN